MPYRKAAIRPYKPEDRPLLFGLARMSLGTNSRWSDERTLGVLEGDTVFVAEIDGVPAGFVAVDEGPQTLRIDELFVVPDHEDESSSGSCWSTRRAMRSRPTRTGSRPSWTATSRARSRRSVAMGSPPQRARGGSS